MLQELRDRPHVRRLPCQQPFSAQSAPSIASSKSSKTKTVITHSGRSQIKSLCGSTRVLPGRLRHDFEIYLATGASILGDWHNRRMECQGEEQWDCIVPWRITHAFNHQKDHHMEEYLTHSSSDSEPPGFHDLLVQPSIARINRRFSHLDIRPHDPQVQARSSERAFRVRRALLQVPA